MLKSPISRTSTGSAPSRAFLRSAISDAMRSMPPIVPSSLRVARRVFRCRPYADQVRVHVIGVQDRKAQYFLLFRCRRLPADRTDKGGVLRVDQAHRHSLPLCMANGLGLGGLPRVRPDPDLPSRGPAKAVWRRASLGRSCAALSNLYIGRTLGCFPMLPSIRAASRSWLLTALTRRYARGR